MEKYKITCTNEAENIGITTNVDLDPSMAMQVLSSIPNILLLTEAFSMGWEIDKLPAFHNGSSRYWILTDDIGNEYSWPGEWNHGGMVSFSSEVAEQIRSGIQKHRARIHKEGRDSHGKG